jgi:hypothetical protein
MVKRQREFTETSVMPHQLARGRYAVSRNCGRSRSHPGRGGML